MIIIFPSPIFTPNRVIFKRPFQPFYIINTNFPYFINLFIFIFIKFDIMKQNIIISFFPKGFSRTNIFFFSSINRRYALKRIFFLLWCYFWKEAFSFTNILFLKNQFVFIFREFLYEFIHISPINFFFVYIYQIPFFIIRNINSIYI